MSFTRYPEYKDSGVEWLGEVPEHWQVKRLSLLSQRITNGYVGPTRDILTDDGVRYLQSLHIKRNEIHFDTPYFVSKEWSDRHSKSILEVGDVLIVQTGDIGQVTVVTEEFAGCNCHALIIIAPIRSVVDGEWISWVLNADYGLHSLLSIQTGALHPHLNCGDVKDIAIPLPPLTEQTKIAEFLDRETAKVDDLVAEQRRLIELLKEKRQAAISHAVTKGLNSKAPVKHSGVEWLGDMPAHWELKPLKYSITKIEQGWSPQCESEPAAENEWGVLKVGCGNRDKFDPTEQKALPLDLAPLPNYEIKAGDILVSRGNTLELVGMATFVEEVRSRLLLCDLLYRFHAKPERAEGEFLVLSLRSPNVRFQIERDATGTSASMKKIGQGTIREFVIALPPLKEQRAIIMFIHTETAKLDALTAEAQRAIDLLHERRGALISAAVTGQIDVRPCADKQPV